MINIRTDLALESREIYKETNENQEIIGVTTETYEKNEILITKVVVENEEGSEKLNKPIGKYVTLESQKIKELDPQTTKDISIILKEELKELINVEKGDSVLVVGLGNWNITPDALGPKVISTTMVTKHLIDYIPEHVDDDIRPVCGISPGVLGITGIETSDIIEGIVNKTNPKLVIAVDALASRNPSRISTTIQITDTGINPGSGVGNKRMGLTKETLGVPVIGIGVPTVVDAISIANDVMNKLFSAILDNSEKDSNVYGVINQLKNTDSENLLKAVIDDEEGSYMVTPKEIDNIITHISKVISNGINLVLHKDIDLEYIENFTF